MHIAPTTVVDAEGPDPFRAQFNAWPASEETWDYVYAVSTQHFNTEDPPLWTPLQSPADRRTAFIEHENRCLNCGYEGHSMRVCSSDFINTFGLLNPLLGELRDDGQAFRRWQQRMRSFRREQSRGRSQSRPHSGKQTKRNNNRHNNNRGNQQRHHGSSAHSGGGGHPSAHASQGGPSTSAPATSHTSQSGSAPQSTGAGATMRYGPPQDGANPNGRQPGTYRSN